MSDEIIQKLWRIKEELASEASYDVHVLCQKLRECQAASPAKIVDRSGHSTADDIEHDARPANEA